MSFGENDSQEPPPKMSERNLTMKIHAVALKIRSKSESEKDLGRRRLKRFYYKFGLLKEQQEHNGVSCTKECLKNAEKNLVYFEMKSIWILAPKIYIVI